MRNPISMNYLNVPQEIEMKVYLLPTQNFKKLFKDLKIQKQKS